jgi:transcriptional regulator with XRE-family HTH domain
MTDWTSRPEPIPTGPHTGKVTAPEPFGILVHQRRMKRGLTQQQLADLSTVAVRTIRDLEAGRTSRPHPETVRLLSKVLRFSQHEYSVIAHGLSDDDGSSDLDHMDAPPSSPDAIIGRQDEISAICELMLSSSHRLVTITGFAGVGKTALAIDCAGAIARMTDTPVRWIDVHRPSGHMNGRAATWLDVATVVGDDRMILVLDDLARGPIATEVAALVRRHPGLRVLATARAPLAISGEWVVPLTPLALPARDADGDPPADAVVALKRFVQRVQPGFRLTEHNSADVYEICHRLDGLPGLLERLAMAFLLFTPDVLLRGLRSDPAGFVGDLVPDIDAIARSAVAGLAPDTRRVFAQVSAADGDWSITEVADAAGIAHMTFAREVRRLLESGLVRPSSLRSVMRFQVLDLVRAVTTPARGVA